MAESYRPTEEKQGSLIDYGKRNNQDLSSSPPKKKRKEACRSITILQARHRLDGEPERWLGM